MSYCYGLLRWLHSSLIFANNPRDLNKYNTLSHITAAANTNDKTDDDIMITTVMMMMMTKTKTLNEVQHRAL